MSKVVVLGGNGSSEVRHGSVLWYGVSRKTTRSDSFVDVVHQTKILVVLVVIGWAKASKADSFVDVNVLDTRASDSRYWLSCSP